MQQRGVGRIGCEGLATDWGGVCHRLAAMLGDIELLQLLRERFALRVLVHRQPSLACVPPLNLGMFLGPVRDVAVALTPTTIAKGTLPSADQQGFVNGNATDQLRLHNPEFRQQWNQFTNLLRNRGANSPEAAALSNSLRQQVNAAVANGNDQPITDPRQKATAALLNDSQFLQAYDYVEANGKGPNANSPGVQKAREWVNQVIDRQMAFDADTSD